MSGEYYVDEAFIGIIVCCLSCPKSCKFHQKLSVLLTTICPEPRIGAGAQEAISK